MFNFLALLDIIRSFWSLITIVASDWPRTFFTARLFLFSISLLFVSIQKQNILFLTRNLQFLHPGCFLIAYGYYVEAYETDATYFKILILKNSGPQFF